MALDNDTRGALLVVLSAIGVSACVLGASIIFIDKIIRLFPGQSKFRIEENNPFLSSSLSLSFGVMLFSSLFSMLPSAKSSLQKAGFSPRTASWMLIGLFLAGVVGIQAVSRILHRYMPSHIVDCDHAHEDEFSQKQSDSDHGQNEHPKRRHVGQQRPPPKSRYFHSGIGRNSTAYVSPDRHDMTQSSSTGSVRADVPRRPSFPTRISRVSQLVSPSCIVQGQCYGYSDLCNQDCFYKVQSRGGVKLPRQPTLSRTTSTPPLGHFTDERPGPLRHVDEESPLLTSDTEATAVPMWHEDDSAEQSVSSADGSEGDSVPGHPHHHHVPSNAFLSIGLQTSLAIALHKLPEGFITYATNHANPRLGIAVFLALFIHNITEGFAMALPLYLALGSRLKAIAWSVLLGGVSQPLGAGIAALWLKLAGKGAQGDMGEGVYGGMFAVTAGIMASVALQLFAESLDLTHNRNLCMVFAFIGMGILGVSSALTAS